MTCRTALSLLDDYVDGDLDASSACELEDHLEGCASCRQELADTKRLKELLKNSKPSTPDSDYWQQTTHLILARIVEAEPQRTRSAAKDRDRRKRHAFVRSIVSLAASIAILVSAILVGESRHHSPSTFAVAGIGQSVYFTEALAGQLDLDDAVYTTDDRRRLARGMLMMGSPATPGRLAMIIEMVQISQGTENADIIN